MVEAPLTRWKCLWHSGGLANWGCIWYVCNGAPPAYYDASGLMGMPLAGCNTYGLVRRLWLGPHSGASTLNNIRAPLAWTK